jgi:hypothetical protein
MRKLYFLLCFVGLSAFTFGQTFLQEDFSDNQMPPSGWTIDNLASQWSINNGASAGGTAPEAMFTWLSGVSTSRLISPEIDLTGIDAISFQFTHFLDDYSGTGYNLGVATRSGGGAWNDVWTVAPTGDIGPEVVTFEINNSDVGASDFQIAVYISGNTYNLDYWYLDNLWLFVPYNLDASMVMIGTPSFLGGSADVTGAFVNFGQTQINSIEINWQVDDGTVTTTLIDGLSLDFSDQYEFILDGMFDKPIGTYTLTTWIETVNGTTDDNPDNNLLAKTVSVVSNVVYRKVFFEEFTSSTCAPCATLNSQFVPWCEDHFEDISLLKYQMNWPGSGDPYYTAEGGVRKDYYGVSGVPAVFVNGTYIGYQFGGVQPAFDEAVLMPGLLSAISSYTINGTEITIDLTLLPYAAFEDYILHVAVFEYLTTQNATTNGETEFEHVMMKMVPNAYGTTVNLEDRVPFSWSQTIDLNGTFVEEWDDLGVVVWLQEPTSKEVFQSVYGVEDGVFSTDAALTEIMVDGEPLEGFSPDVYDYTVTLSSTAVEVPLVEATVSDPNGLAIIVPANELPGSTTVDVFAEDLATHNTYTVNFDLGTGFGNKAVTALNVYPNPTNGLVYITGADNAKVTVFNTTGAVVAEYSSFNSGQIDLTNLKEGIYFLNIVIDNKTTLNKKISVLK